jgi:hypothetical protein
MHTARFGGPFYIHTTLLYKVFHFHAASVIMPPDMEA